MRITTATTQAQDMANVTVVTGPPAAGKTTHVRQHAQPGDVIIDYDHLANALSGQDEDNHDHPAHIQAITRAARQAALDAAVNTSARVWLIHAMPSKKQQANYSARGAEIITIDPGKDVVMKRIKTERPARMAKAAGKWYANQAKPRKKSRQERGYDRRHERQRARLMHQLKDGSPCPHCGKPRFKDPGRNFDGAPLEANHSDPLANYADKRTAPLADELLHRFCNRSLGDYSRQSASPASAPGGFDWQSLG